MRDLRRSLKKLNSVRAWQRCIARWLCAVRGFAYIEQLRELCKKLKCYDSAHFRDYMCDFGWATENGKLLGWYTTNATK